MYQRRMFTEELALQLSENESNKLHFEMEALNNNIYAIMLLELRDFYGLVDVRATLKVMLLNLIYENVSARKNRELTHNRFTYNRKAIACWSHAATPYFLIGILNNS